jgi:hypothetical protein
MDRGAASWSRCVASIAERRIATKFQPNVCGVTRRRPSLRSARARGVGVVPPGDFREAVAGDAAEEREVAAAERRIPGAWNGGRDDVDLRRRVPSRRRRREVDAAVVQPPGSKSF